MQFWKSIFISKLGENLSCVKRLPALASLCYSLTRPLSAAVVMLLVVSALRGPTNQEANLHNATHEHYTKKINANSKAIAKCKLEIARKVASGEVIIKAERDKRDAYSKRGGSNTKTREQIAKANPVWTKHFDPPVCRGRGGANREQWLVNNWMTATIEDVNSPSAEACNLFLYVTYLKDYQLIRYSFSYHRGTLIKVMLVI